MKTRVGYVGLEHICKACKQRGYRRDWSKPYIEGKPIAFMVCPDCRGTGYIYPSKGE